MLDRLVLQCQAKGPGHVPCVDEGPQVPAPPIGGACQPAKARLVHGLIVVDESVGVDDGGQSQADRSKPAPAREHRTGVLADALAQAVPVLRAPGVVFIHGDVRRRQSLPGCAESKRHLRRGVDDFVDAQAFALQQEVEGAGHVGGEVLQGRFPVVPDDGGQMAHPVHPVHPVQARLGEDLSVTNVRLDILASFDLVVHALVDRPEVIIPQKFPDQVPAHAAACPRDEYPFLHPSSPAS